MDRITDKGFVATKTTINTEAQYNIDFIIIVIHIGSSNDIRSEIIASKKLKRIVVKIPNTRILTYIDSIAKGLK